MGLYVRKSKVHQYTVWEENKTSKSRSRKPIPRESYGVFGFNYAWSFDEAAAWSKLYNKKQARDRKTIVAAALRAEDEKLVDSIYLPENWLKEFDVHIDEISIGADNWNQKLKIHWKRARAMILKLEITPDQFHGARFKILNEMLKEKYSVGYIKRIRYILNLWGSFYARQTKTFFEPIPALTGSQREKVIDAHEDKEEVRKPSVPLLWKDLKNKASVFETAKLTEQWNWLFIGVWFGLRPKEIDSLHTPQGKLWRIDRVKGHSELHVFQTKLKGISKDERWKVIPAIFVEQIKALELILSGQFKRPLVKTMVRHLQIEGVDTYSPRKAFTDLMLEKGFDLEDIAIFMGHRDVSMTWKHYKEKKTYKLPKTGT